MELLKQRDDEELTVEGRKLKLTNLGKIFFPTEKITKGEILNYYTQISSYILPYLKGRPESLLRYPNGIFGKHFYQKNMNGILPDWIESVEVPSETEDKITKYMIVNDLPSLLFLINLGCIDLNPWNSDLNDLDRPDYLIIDLDPEAIEFKFVVRAALKVKEVCDELNIPAFIKTSGATGIHIWLPMGGRYSYEQVRNFAQIIVTLVHNRIPDFTSLERSPSNRQGKVYLDWLQNAKGQTLASSYSIRPREGAPVSTPLDWQELNEKILPTDFTIHNIFDRLKKLGDPMRGFFKAKPVDITAVLKTIENK